MHFDHSVYTLFKNETLCIPLIISRVCCWQGDCFVQIWHSERAVLAIRLLGLHQLEHSHLHFKCGSFCWCSYQGKRTMSAAAEWDLTAQKTPKPKNRFYAVWNFLRTINRHLRRNCQAENVRNSRRDKSKGLSCATQMIEKPLWASFFINDLTWMSFSTRYCDTLTNERALFAGLF